MDFIDTSSPFHVYSNIHLVPKTCTSVVTRLVVLHVTPKG